MNGYEVFPVGFPLHGSPALAAAVGAGGADRQGPRPGRPGPDPAESLVRQESALACFIHRPCAGRARWLSEKGERR